MILLYTEGLEAYLEPSRVSTVELLFQKFLLSFSRYFSKKASS